MTEELKNEIKTTLDNWLEAFNAWDIDKLMSYYDPDINYVNHELPRLVGIPAVRENFKDSFALQPKLIFEEEQVMVGPLLGYITGKYKMEGINPENQEAFTGMGRVVTLFRKDSDGNWKLLFDMDNRPPDVKF